MANHVLQGAHLLSIISAQLKNLGDIIKKE